MGMYDITQPLFESVVYPGDPAPTFERVKFISNDGYNLTTISLCVHNGTHVDAPSHFVENGIGIGKLPLDIFHGACIVKTWDGVIPSNCKRLLLKGYDTLTLKAAQTFVESGIRLIGVENQSVGDADVHRLLLSNGVIPLEGLVLKDVPIGKYSLYALPLNLGDDCDGSPVRAVLFHCD